MSSIIVNPYTFSRPLLLDSYPSPVVAYSVRRLNSSYTSSLLRVRRSSDNTEQDIGYDSNGNLDETALTNFVGAGNGFVTTWYDQSGGGYNATMTTTTRQPRIVNGGTVEKTNNKVSLFFDGTDVFVITGILSGFQNVAYAHMFAVAKSNLTTTAQRAIFNASVNTSATFARCRIGHHGSANADMVGGRRLDADAFVQVGTSALTTNQQIFSGMIDYADAKAELFLNGTTAGSNTSFQTAGNTSNAASSTMTIGGIGTTLSPSSFWTGHIQEVVCYSSNQNTTRIGIQENLNAYFNVY